MHDVIVLLTPPSCLKRHWFLTNCPYRLKSKKLHFTPAQLATQSFIIKIMTWLLLFSWVRKEHPHSRKANELRLIFMLMLHTHRNQKNRKPTLFICLYCNGTFFFVKLEWCFFAVLVHSAHVFQTITAESLISIVIVCFRTPNIIPMQTGKVWFSPYAHKRYQ